MQILLGALIALLGIGLVLVSRSITTFFHEMGHALPALLFTDQQVTVYVGSYGDERDSLKFQFGRLTLYLRFNFLAWDLGQCSHQGASIFWQLLLIILGGPVASLLLALTLINVWVNQQPGELTIFVLAVFITSTIWDFIINLIPRKAPVPLHDGSVAYSDGYQLVRLFQEMRYPKRYFEGLEHFHQKEYNHALLAFEEVLESGTRSSDLYQQAMRAALANQAYDRAMQLFQQYQNWYKPKKEDWVMLGDIYYGLRQLEAALNAYNQAWYYRVADKTVLLKRGKLFLHFGEPEAALRDFDTAILYDPSFAEAYAQRALIHLQLDHTANAKQDAETALQLGADQGECYFILGKYYEATQQYALALEHYEKAKAAQYKHHGLNFLIEDVRRWL